MDLDSVADELYGLLPNQFVAARDAQAAAARRAGERSLADAITALRKPSPSAWLANLIVRECRAELNALLSLRPAFQEAQERRAGDELRQLSQRRSEAVEDVMARAETRARSLGQPVSAQTLREVEATLQAAVADPAAADAVQRGQLTAGLAYSGFGARTPEADVAEPRRIKPSNPGTARAKSADAAEAARRQVEARRREVARAERERDRALSRLQELEAKVKAMRAEAAEAGQSLREAEKLLARARRDAEAAAREARADSLSNPARRPSRSS